MKNSTLIFRTALVIIILAGGAHLFSQGMAATSQTEPVITKPTEQSPLPEVETEPESPLAGSWMAQYQSAEFTGAVIYSIKADGKRFKAYAKEYRDEQGYSEPAGGDLVLTIKSFDGSKGRGVYSLEYEGETYKVDCKLALTDPNTLQISYDYYGYKDSETWNKL